MKTKKIFYFLVFIISLFVISSQLTTLFNNGIEVESISLKNSKHESWTKIWIGDTSSQGQNVVLDSKGNIIVHGSYGNGNILIKYNDSGEELWNFRYEAKGEIPFPGSRTVPTVDKTHIWSVGPHGDMYCFDKSTGLPVWNHNLLEEFDRELTTWGVSQAPLIYQDLAIVAPQGLRAGVAAFKKTTGELIWSSPPLNGRPFHVSPSLASFGGVDQVVMISPYDREDSTRIHQVVSLDAQSGKLLWKYEGLKSFATITPAMAIDDQRLFLTDCSYNGQYGPVSIMLEITREGGDFKVKELFLTEEAGSKMHPAVQFENHLYLNHTGNPNQMMCLSLDGNVLWEKGAAPGFELGGMILVDGLIINQNGKNGDIHLIQPSPNGYMELGKASFFSSRKSQAWAPLAFSQGKLIVRDLEKMVCVDLQILAE